MVALTPLLHAPPRFSELEPEPLPCEPPARGCESWRDSALYPFFLADGELFVHPCADLDEWYASARDDAAAPDCRPAQSGDGVGVAEKRVTVSSGGDLFACARISAPRPCVLSLPSSQNDVTNCWTWAVPTGADDSMDRDDAESLSGMTWSSESVSSWCPMTDDELEISFGTAGAQTYCPIPESQMDQTAPEGPAIGIPWQRTKSPSNAPDPEVAEYGDLIQSILSLPELPLTACRER